MEFHFKTLNLLLIEDDYEDVKLIKIMLNEHKEPHFILDHSDRLSSGIENLNQNKYDLILCDLSLPDSSAENTLKSMKDISKDLPIIILTSLNDIKTAIRSIGYGIQDYIVKDELEGSLLTKSIRYAIERKRIQDQLRYEKLRAQKFLEVANVIMLIIDTDGIINLINQKGCKLLKCQNKNLIGKNWFENFILKEWIEVEKEFFNKLLFSENLLEDDYERESPIIVNNIIYFISWKYSVLKDENGNTSGLLLSGEDVTEKRKSEQAIQKAKNLNELLIDIFKRDLTNYIQKLEWNFDVVKDLIEKIPDLEESIKLEIERDFKEIWNLIHKIDLFQEIDEKKITTSKINLTQLIDKAIQQTIALHSDKEIQFKKNYKDEPIYINADEFFIHILLNLFHNAVKFNESKIIHIEINISSSNKDFIQIEIIDNARGIPDSKKARIFERLLLSRIKSTNLGLGLTLVAKIIDRYQAKIWVENKSIKNYKDGSKFMILIPKFD